jgi:hypothetical protein
MLFLVFLHGALEENIPVTGRRQFFKPQFSEQFRKNIASFAAGIFPRNGRNGNGRESLILAETVSSATPAAVHWLMVPSMRNFLQVLKNTPKAERFFPVYLLSESYTGIGMETARETWEEIRNIEGAVTGRDSLGMFPAAVL